MTFLLPSRCPVCRYCQTPEPVEENKCFECGVQEVSRWVEGEIWPRSDCTAAWVALGLILGLILGWFYQPVGYQLSF